MAASTELRLVNAAGLVQGITLVTFPAASSILTSSTGYDLSSSQYGSMFLPQVVAAIVASLLGSRLGRSIGSKDVLLLGLAANAISMTLLLSSALIQSTPAAYPLLLASTAFLGIGFGLTVPTLNRYAAALAPATIDRSVLVLNALLGLGTALAPIIVALFVGLGMWWGLPALSLLLLLSLMVAGIRQPLRIASDEPTAADPSVEPEARSAVPARFWLFAGFAVLYGICETLSGNWSEPFMTQQLGATATQASAALAAFWAMVTIGRVAFAALGRWVPGRIAFHGLPFVLVVAFAALTVPSTGAVGLGIALFALAGLGCSALLPLTISIGQEAVSSMSATFAGGVIASYQVGYGIAAFGVGPLLRSGGNLSSIYGFAAVVAASMGLLSFAVAHRRPSPASLHPRPQEG